MEELVFFKLVLLNKLAVQITHINVNKQPNQKQYDGNTDLINLTCAAIGNPEPEYIWFKQDNRRTVLSRTNTYVIEDFNRNNSGIYICEAYNRIDNIIYKYSYAVPIDIGKLTFAFMLVKKVKKKIILKRSCTPKYIKCLQ